MVVLVLSAALFVLQVSLLLMRQQFVIGGKNISVIYIGDDQTDEDAFEVLKNQGITVIVGPIKISQAKYFLENTNEVSHFLKEILNLKSAHLKK